MSASQQLARRFCPPAAYLSLKADSSAGSCCASQATSSSSDAAGTGTDTRAARSARPVSPTPRRPGVARKCRTASGSGPGTTCRRCSSRAASPWVGQGRVCRWRSYCNVQKWTFFTTSYVALHYNNSGGISLRNCACCELYSYKCVESETQGRRKSFVFR